MQQRIYLVCAIGLFSKYAWVVSLKDKKGIPVTNAFQKTISKVRKPNKIWVEKGMNLRIIFLNGRWE